MIHEEQHSQAGETVAVQFKGGHAQIPGSASEPVEFVIEDWWDRINGVSWMLSDGNPAALIYGLRSGFARLPIDDNVVYGKVGAFGHLVHVSEIVEAGA